jgi:predicted P-loop ATPase
VLLRTRRIKTARELSIAVGGSRNATKWINKLWAFDEIVERVRRTRRTAETAAEYHNLPKALRDNIKDVGGFTCGHCAEGRRKRENVQALSMIKLDGDAIKPGFLGSFEQLNTYECVLYSTHSHTPEAPRYRILFPAARDMTVEESNAVARYIAAGLGFDQFDPCSYIPHQLMYWPSTPSDGEFVFRHYEGAWLDPDAVLAQHPEWRDCSRLPSAAACAAAPRGRQQGNAARGDGAQQETAAARGGMKQQDPLAKGGVVGAFCRAYSIKDVLEGVLASVYAPTAQADRYTYRKGESSGGLVLYEGKFAYSYHATDPARGKECSAFDLVRIHLFGDSKASFKAMCEYAAKDEKVGALLLAEKQAQADSAPDEDWTKRLQRDKGGLLINNLHNITLIIENDAQLKPIVFNQLADGLEIRGDVPWKHPSKFWRDADDAQLISYVDSHYGAFRERNYYLAITKVADDRSYHPVREYLDGLPPWDKTPRVDTLLIERLGAEDTAYTRAVTRKTLTAAVKRVYRPGIKFDNILVFNGPQGIGKSTLIARLGMDWYSDSLSLTDMNDKTAAEKVQGNWLLEISELAGMRRAEQDKIKAFASRTDDKYRASFGRRVTSHPRQCVLFGTTNSERGFLRDITGNRRFWTVKTPGSGVKQPWALTQAEVDQIWAEARVYARAGEKLYLEAELEACAKTEQKDAMEQDEREGLVRTYLDLLLPAGWGNLDIYERREFVNNPRAGISKRETVTNIEIWCECFGRPKEAIEPRDSHAIASIMERIEGWEKAPERVTLPIYGRQRGYRRR